MNPAYPQPDQKHKFPAYPQSPELKGNERSKVTLIRTIIRVIYTILQSTRFLLAILCFLIPLILGLLLGGLDVGGTPSSSTAGQGNAASQVVQTIKSIIQTPSIVSGSIFIILAIGGITLIFLKHRLASRIMLAVYALILIALYSYLAIHYHRNISPLLDGLDKQVNNTIWYQQSAQDRATFQRQYQCCGFRDPEDHPSLPCPPKATKGCSPILAQMAKDAGVNLPKADSITSPIRHWAKVAYIIAIVVELFLIGLAATVLFI
jgi:hypothetical protein